MKDNRVNNNIKFYTFIKILSENSHINAHTKITKETIDDHHILTIKEIQEKMMEKNYKIDRRTIYKYIEDLEELGFDISKYEDNGIGYAIRTKDLEPYELRILVDCISASRFITKKKTNELIEKLCKLQNVYAQYRLSKQVFIDNRSKSINEEILYSIANIDEALDKKKKISFNYCDYNHKRELVYRTKKDTNEKKLYKVTPVGLILKEDHYYLVTSHDKYDNLTNYRVDRMKNVQLLNEKARPLNEISGYEDGKFNAAMYSKKNFKMFAGDDCEVVLRINKNLLNLVIDELGEDVKLYKIDENTFQARFNAQYGTGLTKWVLQLGADANVISPVELREDVRKSLEDMIKLYR